MNERSTTTRLSDDGLRLIIVERWLDRQVLPPPWRSKNRHRELPPADVGYYRQRSSGNVRLARCSCQLHMGAAAFGSRSHLGLAPRHSKRSRVRLASASRCTAAGNRKGALRRPSSVG